MTFGVGYHVGKLVGVVQYLVGYLVGYVGVVGYLVGYIYLVGYLVGFEYEEEGEFCAAIKKINPMMHAWITETPTKKQLPQQNEERQSSR